MIPTLDEVEAAYAFLARRFGLARELDQEAVADALHEATDLAAGRVEDEPAALLFAMTKRPRRLGDAWQALPLVLAENMARTSGLALRLDVNDVDLESLRLRVVARLATFEEVRAWVESRLR